MHHSFLQSFSLFSPARSRRKHWATLLPYQLLQIFPNQYRMEMQRPCAVFTLQMCSPCQSCNNPSIMRVMSRRPMVSSRSSVWHLSMETLVCWHTTTYRASYSHSSLPDRKSASSTEMEKRKH